MHLKSLSAFALMLILAATPSRAQSREEKESKTEIGSAVLQQQQDQKYSYEKVIDVPGTDKTVLYDRAKKWIIANLKTSQESLFFDEENKASITANTAVPLKDNLRLSSQRVEFKLSISIKEGKLRIQGTDFVYRSIYPGTLHQKAFNDLNPFSKGVRRTIYKEFDEQFEAMLDGLSNAVKKEKEDNW